MLKDIEDLIPKFQCVVCSNPIELKNETVTCPKCGIDYPITFGDIVDFCVPVDPPQKSSQDNQVNNYIFVFSTPLSVTDIQYQELFHLLCENCLDGKIPVIKKIRAGAEFFANEDGQVKLEGSWPQDPVSKHCNTEILPFEHSCLVRSCCEFGIKEIVRNSGYIQSAGKALTVANWKKMTYPAIYMRLKQYAEKTQKNYALYFYTTREIKDDDKEKGKDTVISGIAIDHKRAYIGKAFFIKEMPRLKQDFEDYCKDYSLPEYGGAIFVYHDYLHIINEDTLYPDQSDIHCMIIYHSEYKKQNPFHDLNEDRPYWHGIFTTPHDLTCAMVNIARVRSGQIIYDPFMHMGTTAIEAAKFGCTILGSDFSEPVGAKDNYSFVFNENVDGITQCMEKLIRDQAFMSICSRWVNDSIEEEDDKAFPESDIEKIFDANPDLKVYEKRLVYYMARRYQLRCKQGVEKKDRDFILNEQLRIFKKFHKVNQRNISNPDGWLPEDPDDVVDDWDYKTRRIGPTKSPDAKFIIFRANAEQFPLANDSIDAIITDPPYGYGDDMENLQILYERFVQESFRVLRNRGNLVMCMLDKVKTGKDLDEHTTTRGVVALINRIAREQGICIVEPEVIPLSPSPNLNYWKSEHALNRAIIHLEIVKPGIE